MFRQSRAFSSYLIKCFPDESDRVRDCSNVRIAKRIRIISSTVLPGSFWWDDLTYRWMTAEPGSLLNVVSRVVRACARKLNTGSKVEIVDVVRFIVSAMAVVQRRLRYPERLP